jgi:hypothetical protein
MKPTNIFELASSEGRRSDDGVTNPIIATMLRGREGKREVAVIDGKGLEALSVAAMQSLARHFFGDEAIREVGSFILFSLLVGDREAAIKALKDAFKEADRIFRRNLERELLKQALVVMDETGRKPSKRVFIVASR